MSPEMKDISLLAPMPGVIVSVKVAVGDAVKQDDVILEYEAMKMKNVLLAPEDCTIKQLNVAAGQNVKKRDVLVILTVAE